MFEGLIKPVNFNKIMDQRVTFDPLSCEIMHRYETGHSIFLVLSIPRMLSILLEGKIGKKTGINYSAEYGELIRSYVRVLEREFKGLEGIEDITSDTATYEANGNGDVGVNFINSVSVPYSGNIKMHYSELAGSVITRTHELFLRGLCEHRVIKHYNGLIADGLLEPNYKNEVFEFMYIITDPTGYRIEKAFYIFNAQPITASHSNYDSEKGSFEFKELDVEFVCNIATGNVITNKAKIFLEALTGCSVNADGTVTQRYAPLYNYNSYDYKYDLDQYDPSKNIWGKKETKKKSNNKKDNSSSNNTPVEPTIQDGDNNKDSTPSPTNVKIDSPFLKVGMTVWIKPNSNISDVKRYQYATYVYCKNTGTLDKYPSTYKKPPKTPTIEYHPESVGFGKVTNCLSKSTAQLFANITNRSDPYLGTKLFPYAISFSNSSAVKNPDCKQCTAKDILYYDEATRKWRDAQTGKAVSDKDAPVKPIDSPLYKVGDSVIILDINQAYSGYDTSKKLSLPDNYLPKYKDHPWPIAGVYPIDKANELANISGTTVIYGKGSKIHAYVVDIMGKKYYFSADNIRAV